MPSVTRKPSARRMERRATMERRLLEATERLMTEGLTFTELSVDRLATEAGISRATFYVYFEDKGHMLRQLAQQVLAELAEAARPWWQAGERLDPDRTRAGMRRIIATFRVHRQVLTAIIETASYDPDVSATYRDLIEGIAANTRDAIEQGQAAGLIRPMPSAEAASALTWMVERSCHQILRDDSPETDERLAEALTQLLWGALYLQSPGA